MTDYLSACRAEVSLSRHFQHFAGVNAAAGETWRERGLVFADVIDYSYSWTLGLVTDFVVL